MSNYITTKPSIINIWKSIAYLVVSNLLFVFTFINFESIIKSEVYKMLVDDMVGIFMNIYDFYDNEKIYMLSIFTILLVLIPLIVVGYKFIYNLRTVYELDEENKVVMITTGVFTRDTDNITFDKILDSGKVQSFIEMIMKKGTLNIYTRGDLSGNPVKLSQKEKEQIAEINQSVDFGYVSMKKISSINLEILDIMDKIVKSNIRNANGIS